MCTSLTFLAKMHPLKSLTHKLSHISHLLWCFCCMCRFLTSIEMYLLTTIAYFSKHKLTSFAYEQDCARLLGTLSHAVLRLHNFCQWVATRKWAPLSSLSMNRCMLGLGKYMTWILHFKNAFGRACCCLFPHPCLPEYIFCWVSLLVIKGPQTHVPTHQQQCIWSLANLEKNEDLSPVLTRYLENSKREEDSGDCLWQLTDSRSIAAPLPLPCHLSRTEGSEKSRTICCVATQLRCLFPFRGRRIAAASEVGGCATRRAVH